MQGPPRPPTNAGASAAPEAFMKAGGQQGLTLFLKGTASSALMVNLGESNHQCLCWRPASTAALEISAADQRLFPSAGFLPSHTLVSLLTPVVSGASTTGYWTAGNVGIYAAFRTGPASMAAGYDLSSVRLCGWWLVA